MSHQLAWVVEPGQIADLGHQRRRHDQGHPAKGLAVTTGAIDESGSNARICSLSASRRRSASVTTAM